jgi:hypothetical protein
MSAAELARGIEAVEADIETQAWARARRKVAGETGAPRLMTPTELARGIEAVEADIETQAWARARRKVAGETG